MLLQKESTQRQTNSWNKHIFLAEIQYVNQCNTSLMELRSLTMFFLHNICLKGRVPLLKNNVFLVLLSDSYGRAYCIHAVMSLLQMILMYIHFYFRFFKIKYCCIVFSINWFIIVSRWIGSLIHLGFNRFFKEHHIQLKQVFTRFHPNILLSF